MKYTGMGAELSTCGRYRYRLTRWWSAPGKSPTNPMGFVGLNPSTADSSLDDATIRTLVRLAVREGYSGLLVVNLFALRATNPEELYAHPDPVCEPTAQGRDVMAESLSNMTSTCQLVVLGWGTRGTYLDRQIDADHMIRGWFPGHVRVLGWTKNGQPRHPLYMRNDAPLIPLPEGST